MATSHVTTRSSSFDLQAAYYHVKVPVLWSSCPGFSMLQAVQVRPPVSERLVPPRSSLRCFPLVPFLGWVLSIQSQSAFRVAVGRYALMSE